MANNAVVAVDSDVVVAVDTIAEHHIDVEVSMWLYMLMWMLPKAFANTVFVYISLWL